MQAGADESGQAFAMAGPETFRGLPCLVSASMNLEILLLLARAVARCRSPEPQAGQAGS